MKSLASRLKMPLGQWILGAPSRVCALSYCVPMPVAKGERPVMSA
jgi:hypothetical protein